MGYPVHYTTLLRSDKKRLTLQKGAFVTIATTVAPLAVDIFTRRKDLGGLPWRAKFICGRLNLMLPTRPTPGSPSHCATIWWLKPIHTYVSAAGVRHWGVMGSMQPRNCTALTARHELWPTEKCSTNCRPVLEVKALIISAASSGHVS